MITFYLHVELLQFFLHTTVGDPLHEWRSSFNIMDPMSGADEIDSESPENFVVTFEILPIDKEWKSNKITYCRSWTSCGFNDRSATLQVDFFLTSTSLKFFNCVLFSELKIQIQFCFHSHSVVDYLNYC